MSHVMRKPAFAICERRRRSLISTFVVCFLDSIIPLVSISEISSLNLASVAAQVGLSLPWSQTPKTGFLVTRLIYLHVVQLSDSGYSNGAWNKQGTSIKLKRPKVKLIHLSNKAATYFYFLMNVTQDNSFISIKNKLCATGIIKSSNSDDFSSNLGMRNLAICSWRFALLLLISNYALQNVLTMSCCANRDFVGCKYFKRSYNALLTTTSTNIKNCAGTYLSIFWLLSHLSDKLCARSLF